MRNTWVSVSSWRLCTGYLATRLSSHSVFQAVIFFLWRHLTEREIIRQSVLTWLKILVILFFLRNIRNAESIFSFTGLYFFISWSMESSLVGDWWWTVWFDILFTFSQLLNLHPCCRIRATKCFQRTIALYQYKLFNLFPFSAIEFCEVVMFKTWTQYVWSKSRILFFFLTTCATSFRIMTPYFTMWVNRYSAKDSDYLVLARS